MLIVAMGILTLLSVMAITFVTLMRLERGAASNYVDGVKAKLVAEAGLNRFIADLGQLAKEPVFDGQAPGGRLKKFVFGADPLGKEINVAKRVEDVDPLSADGRDFFFYGSLGQSYSGGADEFRIKVVDTSALFDLNFYPLEMVDAPPGSGGIAKIPRKGQVLQQMLECLGRQIRAERMRRGLEAWNPLAGANDTDVDPRSRRKPITFMNYVGAEALIMYRLTLDGQRFTSKSQLQEIMEEASFQLLSDYVTANGAQDDFSADPNDTGSTNLMRGLTAGHSSLLRSRNPPRSLININIASRPVLISLLAPLAGRRHVFHVAARGSQAMEARDATAQANYQRGAASAQFGSDQREDISYDVREGYLYVGPFGDQRAAQVVDWIIQQRPFTGYGDLFARLQEQMALGAGSPLAAAMPPPSLLGTGAPITEPGVRYFPSADVRYNINGIESEPYFAQLVRDAGFSILLAAVNPAATINTTVPPPGAFLPVDKGSLLYPVQESITNNTGTTVEPRQTSELCYDTRGVFEVTSLGQIKRGGGELVAQEKILTVVRLLGQVTHRSQNAFERNEATYAGDAATEPLRSGITSFPNRRRAFQSLSPLASPEGDEVSDEAWDAFGHVQMDVRALFDQDAGSGRGRVNTLQHVDRGQGAARLVAAFEWHEAGRGIQQARAFHAFLANGSSYFDQPGATGESFLLNRAFGPIFKWRASATGTLEQRSRAVTDVPSFLATGGGSTNLYSDGVHMSYRSGRDYPLWYRASAEADEDPGAQPDAGVRQGAQPIAADASYTGAPPEGAGNLSTQGNIFYRKGALEFWYKPEFDWTYADQTGALRPFPLYCGYVGASRVFYNPGVKAQDYGGQNVDASIIGRNNDPRGTPTDGTQLYVFRNTEGQIRATRLYFRVVGESDTNPASDFTNTKELPMSYVDPDATDDYGKATKAPYAGERFVGGQLEPTAPATDVGGPIEVYRRGVERRPYTVTPGSPAGTPPKGYPWPPLEFSAATGNTAEPYQLNELSIRHARVDAYVPMNRMQAWRAGEWHHIAVAWDDTGGANNTDPHSFLKIFIDGKRQSEAKIVGDAKNMFVRLNEPPQVTEDEFGRASTGGGAGAFESRYPKDRITVGSIIRRIAKIDEGVFKHRNVFNPSYMGGSGGSGAADPDAPKRIALFACGVVDDFITYGGVDGLNQSLPRAPERFEQEATYVQHFDLSARMPGGNRPLEVARLSWTALLPPKNHGSNQGRGTTGSIDVRVMEPGGIKMRDPLLAGGAQQDSITYSEMLRTYSYAKLEKVNSIEPAVVPSGSPKVKYLVTMRPASYGTGAFGLGAMQNIDTPVLQEVTLTYFLPAPQTLLKERVVD